jgi:hypothetical protein
MNVFIDESGDRGVTKATSAAHFSLAAVLFKSSDSTVACSDRIERLREDRGWERLVFHFKEITHDQKTAFLEAVSPCDFVYLVSVLQKRRLGPEWSDKEYFYTKAAKKLAETLLQPMTAIYAVSGNRGSCEVAKADDPVYMDAMISQLRSMTTREGARLMHKPRPRRMATSNLLQLVDMVCGATLRAHIHGDGQFRKLIRNHEHKLLIWPE